jgi:hypothetical protein
LITYEIGLESEANMFIQAQPQTKETIARDKLIERTSKDFTGSVCSGYLTYYDKYQSKPLSELDVYTFVAQNILDVHGTDAFNADYCTGWIEALIKDRKVLS